MDGPKERMTTRGNVAMALVEGHRHAEDCGVLLEEDRRRLERELLAERAARLKLEEERDRLIAEFTTALATRDDFLSAASHDLKTPLSALQLQIQGALRNAERSGVDQRFEERLKAMNRQVRHLGELVERLLDVPRISSGQLDLVVEEVDLAELVRDLAERFASDLEWARCPLSLRASAKVMGRWDRTRLDQVLSNLLSNAIKYGRGAPIEITVEEVPGVDPRARVSVRDHGIGIAPEQQARVFEKFHRAVTNRTASGLGLGLWIARHIAEASGGSLTVESSPGSGSTFTVELPVAPTER
jgi:signal transduction histidine kinase